MKRVTDLAELRTCTTPITLAAGFFDGLHRGHMHVLHSAIDDARNRDGEAWVLTFDSHPRGIVSPDTTPLLLTSTPHKLRLIEASGVDGCICLPFTRTLAEQTPTEFADWLFECIPSLARVTTGEDWRFGAGGKGSPAQLKELGHAHGIEITAVAPVLEDGKPISSTLIRIAVMRGHLDEAAAMLGRPYSVLGTVVKGHAIGRTIGYPSANLDPHNEALPPLGVYAVRARVAEHLVDGVLNFGTRPTFQRDRQSPPTLELHLLDFDGPLYDTDIEAFFIRHLRDEWYFSSTDELKEQIAADIIQARAILKDATDIC